MTSHPFETDLDKNAANYVPLTPLSFLARTAAVFPSRTSVIHGDQRFTWSQTRDRCHRLASALVKHGIGKGDTVTVMAPNVPPSFEATFGVPMTGAVLNALNIRLDASTIAFILNHGEAKALITDTEFAPIIKQALAEIGREILVIDYADPTIGECERLGSIEYEDFLASGDPSFQAIIPETEWDSLALNYTSGTTGNPKGVVFHHRGAFLNAMGNVIAFGLDSATRYLWTLPMFHCNGWTFTWAVTAVGGTHVCLRAVDPPLIFKLIDAHKVSHMCGAPIVLNMLVHAPDEAKREYSHSIQIATGGAAPPSAVIASMERMGFSVLHLYGLTETYGPSGICAWPPEWDGLELDAKASRMARQGVSYPTLEGFRVVNPDTQQDVPADGETMGEIWIRGNTVMKGYLKNPTASTEAFVHGWFHSGDLAVLHPDG
ncbi:MAG: AMP-binding protein, partial [Alphaproteobacteria bacterium]|nr:AMP-binding protein [Alphaproteobacteria bacterium]